MSITSRLTTRFARALALSACLGATVALPSCAIFGGGGPSLVAQGKYYSSGNPQYDEFFIQLYQLQVTMVDAPRVPDSERTTLALALGIPAEAPAGDVAQRLHEEATKLGQTGLRMRLEQSALPEKPEAASATIRASFRPKDDASSSLLSTVESSATRLLRSVSQMKAAEAQLAKLELEAIPLDAGVPQAFAETRIGKQSEVRKNLADAQKLITLMKARGDNVGQQSEELLTAVAKAVDTDDGSLGPDATEPKAADADPKKPQSKPRAKAKAVSNSPAPSAPASAPKPKPQKPAASDDEAPAKPAAPSRPAAPPRDFEP